jgi:uridine kinase
MLTIAINGSAPITVKEGTCVREIASACDNDGQPWIAALVNNDLVSLSYPLSVNGNVRFITAGSPHGWRVYRWSVCFLLAKAVRDIAPNARFTIEHAIGPGLYCTFNGEHSLDKKTLSAIKKHMHALIAQDLPIERRKISFTDAVNIFEKCELEEKLHLLQYRNPPRVVIHWCDGFCDLAHGPLTQSTGLLKTFDLIPYPPGFIIQLPTVEAPTSVPAFEDQPHLFQIFREHKDWGRILDVTTAGHLNRLTYSGEVERFIHTAEALHEKKLGRIADQITNRQQQPRIVLIAGPSSAGKTTFAKRLATHLRVNGMQPVTIATDDYFVGEAKNPIGADGKPDYEHIEAVDTEAFNRDLCDLIAGRSVPIRRFDFEKRAPTITDTALTLSDEQILIIEGIHGLNPRLTHMIPSSQKFKIYVNALTQLNVDSYNRISTTDNRLIRRMVRDHQFRGHSPLHTLAMWPMVRRGEQRWIFPYQQEADATFNSALDYELAVLKPFVEPLLMQVKPDQAEYAESRRLSEFLLNFISIQEDLVPRNSILREYIGGSMLHY